MPDNAVAPGLIIRQSYPLFEQLSEAAQGWQLDFRQLSSTLCPYWLEQLSTSRMFYSRACFGAHFHQLGGPTLGFRTFALRSDDCTDFRWCGEPVFRDSLLVMAADGEFESVSRPGITSVGNVCLQHGFTHLGQLATDYRRHFGELASATLRRG